MLRPSSPGPVVLPCTRDTSSAAETQMVALSLPLLGLLVSSAAAASPKKSNFVVMLADDMGWGDWSRTGSPAKDVPGGGTPHLEASQFRKQS